MKTKTTSSPSTNSNQAASNGAPAMGPHPHFWPMDWSSFVSRPPKEYLIDRMLGRGDVGMLFAQPGHAKTFLAIDLMFCACQQRDWIGAYHPNRGWEGRFAISDPLTVLYITDEGLSGLSQRFKAAAHDYGLAGMDQRFMWLDRMPQLAPRSAPELSADAFLHQWRYFKQMGKPTPPDLIILDTFANATLGVGENATDEMGMVMADLKRIAVDLDCAILTLHHTGKSGLDYRGSSAIKGALDLQMKIVRAGAGFSLQCEKVKDSEAWDPAGFILTRRLDSAVVLWDNLNAAPGAVKTPSTQDLIFDLLQQYPDEVFSAKEIAEATGQTATTVTNALGRLTQNGKAEQVLLGGRTRFKWQLAAALRAVSP